ncbi:MAG: hypothetical protein SOY97_13280 [Candidatus Metalachnospira sp.]|nr:hypothetical protein [Candidatus Metalachnospira sp.]
MEKSRQWSRLDNAAKIFPPTSSKRDTKVFRFVCELKEPVDGPMLQRALNKTVETFPIYRSILKKGIFWYYLEESTFEPIVHEEDIPVCAPIYDPFNHGLLYRVSYYKYRINFEVFHALTDGTGAIQFLRVLVYHYLEERYKISGWSADYGLSTFQKNMDAFYKYYDKSETTRKPKSKRAYRIHGERIDNKRLGVIEGFMSARAVIDKAHEYDATVSEFLIGVFICAICDNMAVRDRKRPIVVSVPVNMRQYFPSQTIRNFFGVIHVAYKADKSHYEVNEVLEVVKQSFKEQLTKDNISGIISQFSSIESNPAIRAIPLLLKIPVLRLAGEIVARKETVAFSNLGRIAMPDEAVEHIKLFDAFVSTKRPQICLCTFGDILAVGISSPLVNKGIEQQFFRRLTDMGIGIQVISNLEQFNVERDGNNAAV